MKPRSFDDPNIILGVGGTDDYENALPIGSKYRGRTICGVATQKGVPCAGTPLKTGRCFQHSSKEEKTFYNSVLTKQERQQALRVKVGSLKDEIILFKIMLKRLIASSAPIREIVSVGQMVKELENVHFRLLGGEIRGNPFDMVVALRQAITDIDESVVPNE